MTPYLMLLMYH